MRPDDLCPCGTGARFGACCLPLLRSEREASSPTELMRSRYTAFAVGDPDHLWRTWHPRTRPDAVIIDADIVWTGLDILDAIGDEVEFTARYRARGERTAVLHERSRFAVRARRWFYLDGRMRP